MKLKDYFKRNIKFKGLSRNFSRRYVVGQLGDKLMYEDRDYDRTEQLEEFNKLYQNQKVILIILSFSVMLYFLYIRGI